MNITSNYSYYSSSYLKKSNAQNAEDASNVDSSATSVKQSESQLATNSSDESGYFQAKASEERNYYSNYILMSSQPLNKTLTSYRDVYPNIIGFTAKTQSSLSSLVNEYVSKIHGLIADFTNCKTEAEFNSKMKEMKSKISQLMNEYNAKYKDISAIASALPALSEVRNKIVGSELDMHDELDAILKNVSDYSEKSNTQSSQAKGNGKLFGDLEEGTITKKMQDLQEKKKEYKDELKVAQAAQNKAKIEETQALIDAAEKMINVYSAVLSGFSSTR